MPRHHATTFHHLMQALHRQTGQRVMVLADDYDKPILMASSPVCAPFVFVCHRGRWMAASALDAMPGKLRRRPHGHRIHPKS